MGQIFMNLYTWNPNKPEPKLESDPDCPALKKKVNQFSWIVEIQDVKINITYLIRNNCINSVITKVTRSRGTIPLALNIAYQELVTKKKEVLLLWFSSLYFSFVPKDYVVVLVML